jgi:PhzF family phenazine biosynthesis protein
MFRPFQQVDVFTATPTLGNPVAVVLDGTGLSTGDMQRFARWTNLSETTFVLPPSDPSADYHVRIFTTTTELPFAGHPTLGTCHAWLRAGGVPRDPAVVRQQCGLGVLDVRREGDQLAFAAPALRKTGPLDDALLARLCAGLGLTRDEILGHQWLVNGPEWIGLRLTSAERVLSVTPDYAALAGLDIGLIGAHPHGAACQFEVRAFAFVDGPTEDPITGSLNAGLGQWLIAEGVAPQRYVASQGTLLQRVGRVYMQQDHAGRVWVGGQTHTVLEGTVAPI